MRNLKSRIKNLFAKDQLTADGGTVFKDPSGHWRKKRIAKFAGSSFTFGLALFLTLASIGLPFPGKVSAARAEATTILARDGQTELYKIRGEKNRTPIGFEQMPECIKDATVAVEDKSFYKHQGLDPRGVLRAILVNFESGQATQGGSTITQQLVKNALLSPERTLTRKAKELVLSLEIEQMYAKDDILRIYLNEIPYGNNAYGIEAAADTYFGRHAKDLTLAQCATLAAIPRAPTFYSPFNNADPNRLKSRSKFVLDQMVAEKYITGDESAAAKAAIDGPLQAEYAAAKGEEIRAPHFVFYVREQLEQRYGAKTVAEGGLRVVTTLDPAKQEVAEDVIENNARTRFGGFGASNAALTSIDPKTGQIVAMVGSVDYFNTAGEGNVNVATSDRQPGSALKPLVYLAGFKEGRDPNLDFSFNPATLLWDVKTDFGGGYAPNNYDSQFRGPVSARDALQQSLNVPSVKMLDLVGIGDALNLAHEMGITTLNEPERYGDSLVLGGGEVKLVDLTSAYAVLANQGTAAYYNKNVNNQGLRNNSTPLIEIKDRKGKVLHKYEERKREIVSKELAYQMSDVLKDDGARAPQFGRGGPLTLPGRPDTSAKTGTTDSFRDGWTVGYTPQLAAGVWLGNNDNSPMNRVGGSLGAAPIWNEYMRRVLEGSPAEKFERPKGIEEIKVDRLTGKLPGRAGTPTKNEIFTSGNKPVQKSDTDTGADPCQSNVNLGGLHSERPTNPAWENPVQTFIKTRGVALRAPTEDTQNNPECGPEVSIVQPANGATVSGTILIQARATSERGIRSVEFTWDGQAIGSATAPPFTASYTIKDTGGKHTIAARATDEQGNAKTATISVTVEEVEEEPSPSPSPDADQNGQGGGDVPLGYLRDDQYLA